MAATFAQMIDVSEGQGTIDWQSVASSGIKAAYIKATEGGGSSDLSYIRNAAGAHHAGLRVGAYHYFHPKYNAHEQADWFLVHAGIGPRWLPPVLDVEEMDGVPASEVIAGIAAWLEIVEKVDGRPPAIYVTPSFWRGLGDPRDFHRHPLWLADFQDPPDLPGGWPDWSMWQYAPTGAVAGIVGRVDLSWIKPTLL